jgi:hypothetical protein
MSLQDRVSATIGSIYDAALDRGEWMTALRQVSDLLAGTRATLKLQSAADVRLIADTVGANGREDYRSYYRHIEPVLISMHQGPPGVYNSRRIIPKRELFRSEFYNDWGRRHDVAFCIQA